MSANPYDDAWARWLSLHRLQADFMARNADYLGAWISGGHARLARLLGLLALPAWPLPDSGLTRHARAWVEAIEDESRNLAQGWLLTDSEMRDWGQRFARTLDGE